MVISVSLGALVTWVLWLGGLALVLVALTGVGPDGGWAVGLAVAMAGCALDHRRAMAELAVREAAAFELGRRSVSHLHNR
jgi:hypothetical protein